MHLGNSIICPATGIPMLVMAGAAFFVAVKNSKKELSKDKIIPAVLLTTLVFALQMINFSIPFVESSGHIIGAMLLAVLLGPNTAFLAMSAILLIQALFFNDGGLLALGCNIFNMSFLACFVAYPFIFKPLESKNQYIGAALATIVSIQLAVFAISVETAISGSVTNISIFTAFMQIIHFLISLAEGIFTGFIIYFVNKTKYTKTLNVFISVVSIFLAGFISNYASSKPDGLEWSLINIPEFVELQTQNSIYMFLDKVQYHLAVFNNIPSYFANILGLLIIAVFMFIILRFNSYYPKH